MTTATLTFTLPEDQDSFEWALSADGMYNVLFELRKDMRDHLKYGQPLTIQDLYDRLHQYLADEAPLVHL